MAQKQTVNSDVLGAYPQRKQVSAFPERVFIKTNRFLVVFAVINLSLIIAGSGLFVYMSSRVDVKVNEGNVNYVYAIDTVENKLSSLEGYKSKKNAWILAMEKQLREYINEFHSVPFEMSKYQDKVSPSSIVAQMSYQNIYDTYQKEQTYARGMVVDQKQSVRDVHIYDLRNVQGTLWSAYIETFDLPLAEGEFETMCPCSDNSKSCLECKIKNANKRERYKIWLRANYLGKERQSLGNPLGLYVIQYNIGYLPIHTDPKNPTEEKEKFWGLPTALRPAL